MKRLSALLLLLCSLSISAQNTRIQQVPLTQVHLSDAFWTPRIESSRTVSTSTAFHECEQNDTACCESCAVIADINRNQRMFLETGDSKYIDFIEHTLYNNVLSCVSLSGDRFFCNNVLESSGEHERQQWSDCATCASNITRLIASVPGYMYAIEKKGRRKEPSSIYVNLYAQSTVNVGRMVLEQQTDYPWDGKVRIKVKKGSGLLTMKLRMPSWLKASPTNNDLYTYLDRARPYSLSVNGRSFYPEIHDYITIRRTWKVGDVIELDFPMNVRRIVANDSVENLRGKVCLERGPIVYCLEAYDQPDCHVFNKYILQDTPISAHFEKYLLGGIVVLEGQAKQVKLDGNVSDISFRAIPYAVWNNRGPQAMEVWITSKLF